MSVDFEKIYHCRKAISQESCCGNCRFFSFERTEKLFPLVSQSFEPRIIMIGDCINAKNFGSSLTKTTDETVCDLREPRGIVDYINQSIDNRSYCGKMALCRGGICERNLKPCVAKAGIGCSCTVPKWETPEQIEERIGEELPPSALCFMKVKNEREPDTFQAMSYEAAKSYYPTVGRENMIILFDNGHFGIPPENV
jgi:hypothetical protein